MTSMVEKVARAELAEDPFRNSDGEEIAWEDLAPHGRDLCIRRARAALTALLEPDDSMIDAGEQVMRGYEDMRSARAVNEAMIQAALASQEA